MNDLQELYDATQTLFRAFNYLQPRMKGGSLSPPRPMNDEALAGCILHGCMSQLVREIQIYRQRMLDPMLAKTGWITDQLAG